MQVVGQEEVKSMNHFCLGGWGVVHGCRTLREGKAASCLVIESRCDMPYFLSLRCETVVELFNVVKSRSITLSSNMGK